MFLNKRNIPYEIRDLYAETALPAEVSPYGSVVILGGPMNVDEESTYPFLKTEKEFIVECIQRDVPILGVCLGAQLLARVFGADVYKNEFPEIGRMEVEFTEEGIQNLLFKGVSSPLPVFQWHGDTFTLPQEAVHLAHSPQCRHQAFGVRDRFYGVQFHLEITRDEAVKWAYEYMPQLQGCERETALNIQKTTAEDWPAEMIKSADRIMANFFGTIAGYKF
jgi:GMP synthase (glutamine-hydrolysing)